MRWYDPSWDCHTWRVHPEIFSAPNEAKIGLLRGYCDADGSPVVNKSRKQPLIKIESVNHDGLQEIDRISCEEEERVSRGYEINTYFTVDGGHLERIRKAVVRSSQPTPTEQPEAMREAIEGWCLAL